MIQKFKKIAILGVSVFSLSACQTMSDYIPEQITKSQAGTVIGSITGGLIGTQLDCKEKAACQFAGVLIGGVIGNQIGRYLDEQDKAKMAASTQNAILTGKSQSWSNPENKTSGKSVVIRTTERKQPVKVPVLKDKITKVPPLDMLGTTYRATKAANVRGGPGSDYKTVGSLKANQNMTAIGKVKDKNWYMISENGVGSGFVFGGLIEPAPTEKADQAHSQVASSDIAVHQVSKTTTCRVIEQSVKLADGTTKTEQVEACEGANGWEVKGV